MKMIDVVNKYKNNEISKQEYIDLMYENHKYMFEYANFIKDADIKSILIKE